MQWKKIKHPVSVPDLGPKYSVLEYIFEVLVLVEIMVMYSYSCSMYSDFTSTLRVNPSTVQYDIVKII